MRLRLKGKAVHCLMRSVRHSKVERWFISHQYALLQRGASSFPHEYKGLISSFSHQFDIVL